MPYENCGWGGGGWGVWLFAALMLLGLALVVLVAIRLLTRPGPGGHIAPWAGPPPGGPGGSGRAHAILEERYARGEIDAEEYRERRRTLDGDG
ncbi:SHOCT domain-containing protein [Nocardia niigatensis]|uniref:SHOCT domain-containing protein n=1 Tax=Nocardia niigatensis TaxID=209249 RepID=UPI00059361E9|nr:SHOCT domain-containing protein [Nocardia niigatensis]